MTKKSIDLSTVLGLLLGIGGLCTAIFIEFNELNPDLGSPFLTLSALMIIFIGTIATLMLTSSMDDVKSIPKLFKIALFGEKHDANHFINTVVELSEVSRRAGILALEDREEEIRKSYAFLGKGLQYVIDGETEEAVESYLSEEVHAMEERHKSGAKVFESMGGFSPTMGIIGTVVGLIGALSKAGEGGSDPNMIVEAIATAFIATFYGIGMANLVFLPIAGKLKKRSAQEVFFKKVQIEAVLALSRGESPRTIGSTMRVFFSAKDLGDDKSKPKGKGEAEAPK